MRSARILVCDDDDIIVQIVTSKLRSEGFNIATASSGRDALSLLRAELPDLLIVDAIMPGLDGIEVLKTVRTDSRLKNLPVMMLSAKRDPEFIAKVIQCGVTDYVAKPFALGALARRVKHIVNPDPQDALILD